MKAKMKIAIFLLMLLVGVYFVLATPEGPNTLIVNASSKRIVNTYNNTPALAGNVTQLTIAGSSVTQSWQGYYGNVSGTITLETSTGFKMYQWAVANPKGEIYATESSAIPQWGYTASNTSGINCWNYTLARCGTANCTSYAELEGWDTGLDTQSYTPWTTKGIKANSPDSINNTFQIATGRSFPSFYVGTRFINGTQNVDGCPSLSLFNSTYEVTYGGNNNLDPTAADGSVAGGYYQEVILEDNVTQALLFTAIIDFERNTPGFDGRVWDFEMIVPERGTSGDTSTTTYNFYVELE